MEKGKKVKKTAVIYARQSFGNEAESLSVESQIEQCKNWCNRNNVEIIAVCKDLNTSSELYDDSEKGHVYCSLDKAWQAWNKTQITRNRKKYRAGLAEAFSYLPNADFFVVNEKTRFYRNPSPLASLESYCLLTLKENGVALVEVETNSIDAMQSNIQIAVNRLIADYEMEKLQQRKEQSIRSKRKNIENGIVYSNAYGVEWDNKKICFNTAKAEVIGYVFQSVINGKTYAEILYTLNTRYISLATGKCFYESSIYNIIGNSIYCGYKADKNGELIKIKNIASKPIVNLPQWQKANAIVKQRKDNSGKQKYNVKNAERRHFLPFSGLLYCGNCGKRLTMIDDRGIVYFCKNTLLTKNKACTESRIRTNYAGSNDDMLLFIQPLFLINIFEKMASFNKLKNVSENENSLVSEIANLKKRIAEATKLFIGSKIDEVEEVITSAKRELAKKEKELEFLRSEKSANDESFLKNLNRIYDTISAGKRLSDDTYYMLLHETVERITVYPNRIEITLKDGNSFAIPRIRGKYRAKLLPVPSIDLKTEGLQWIIRYNCGLGKEQTIIETKDYKITLF